MDHNFHYKAMSTKSYLNKTGRVKRLPMLPGQRKVKEVVENSLKSSEVEGQKEEVQVRAVSH